MKKILRIAAPGCSSHFIFQFCTGICNKMLKNVPRVRLSNGFLHLNQRRSYVTCVFYRFERHFCSCALHCSCDLTCIHVISGTAPQLALDGTYHSPAQHHFTLLITLLWPLSTSTHPRTPKMSGSIWRIRPMKRLGRSWGCW